MPYSLVLERASGTHNYSVQRKVEPTHLRVLCSVPVSQAHSNKFRFAALEALCFISLWCLGAQRKGMVIIMKPYQRGDVVVIDVPMLANSHIQAGKRPWVVVQNNVGNQFSSTSIVVPLTTKIRRLEMPTHVAVTWGSLQPSMVECEQVRVVDVSDDWEYICTLPPEIMRHVDTALKNAFFYGRCK